MPLRLIVWISSYIAGAVLAFAVHPIYGLYAYFLDYYEHPPLRWWGKSLPDLRWSLLIAGVVIVAYFVRRTLLTEVRVREFPQTKWLLFFVLYSFIVTLSPLAVWKEESWEASITLAKFFVLYWLIIKVAGTKQHFRSLLLCQMLGVASWGWTAFEAPKRAAGRLYGIGGADSFNDNFAAIHIVGLLPLIGIGLFTGKRWEKVVCILVAPFVLNMFILCNSRGPFLALIFMAVASLLITQGAVRKKICVLLVLGSILFIRLVDPTFVRRQQTSHEYEKDKSSWHRIVSWDGAVELIKDHPFGTGGRGFEFLSPIYIPEVVAAHKGQLRGVHSTPFQVASQWGIPGLIFFFGFIWSTLRELRDIRMRAPNTPEGERIALESVALTLGICGVMIGGLFSTRTYGEIVYWLPAFAAVLRNIHTQELRQESEPAALDPEEPLAVTTSS